MFLNIPVVDYVYGCESMQSLWLYYLGTLHECQSFVIEKKS